MHAVEYYHPEIMAVYSDWNQFVDRMIQMPLLLLASFLIILRFANEYERVNRQLDAYANLDELTGLYNRRMFNKAMEEAYANASGPTQLLLLDLDNFKTVNDTYGHDVGDELLQNLSAILKETIGFEQHIISRWGGDEFAVIYHGGVEELQAQLKEVKIAFKDCASVYGDDIGISASIVSFGDFASASQALTAADLNLYQEKKDKHSKI